MAFLLEKHSTIGGFTIYRVDRAAADLNSDFESERTISAQSELEKSRYEARKNIDVKLVTHDQLAKKKEKRNGAIKF